MRPKELGGQARACQNPRSQEAACWDFRSMALAEPSCQEARTKEGSCWYMFCRKNWAQKPGPPYLMLGCSTYQLPTGPAPGPG